jgi:hypothetical protein
LLFRLKTKKYMEREVNILGKLSVRRNVKHIRTISRIIFKGTFLKARSDYPTAFGFVNYKSKVQVAYKTEAGSIYIESTAPPLKGYPLTRVFKHN